MDPELVEKQFQEKLSFAQAMAIVVRYRGAISDQDVATLAVLADELISKRVKCPKCNEFICPYGNT
jgi:hypothetical protein